VLSGFKQDGVRHLLFVFIYGRRPRERLVRTRTSLLNNFGRLLPERGINTFCSYFSFRTKRRTRMIVHTHIRSIIVAVSLRNLLRAGSIYDHSRTTNNRKTPRGRPVDKRRVCNNIVRGGKPADVAVANEISSSCRRRPFPLLRYRYDNVRPKAARSKRGREIANDRTAFDRRDYLVFHIKTEETGKRRGQPSTCLVRTRALP